MTTILRACADTIMQFDWRKLLLCHSIAMSIEGACEDFLQGGDSGVLLVAVSNHVDVGDSEKVAVTLLQEKYQATLVQLGWDLLSLLTPHLCSPDSHTWRLLSRITEVCPPKEMVLALLEQMEVVSATPVFLLLLQPLQKVLLQLEKEMILVSSLRSVTCLVQQHYRKLEGEEGKGKNEEGEEEMEEKEEEKREKEEGKQDQEKGDRDTRTGRQNLDSQAESSDLEPGEVTTKSLHSMSTSGEGNGDMREGVPGRDQSQRSPGEHGSIVCQTGDPGEVGQYSWDTLTVHSAAVQTLEFVQPFVEDIHHQYCSVNMQLLSYWNGRQRECITFLLSLLDFPLVAHNLKSGSKTPNDSRRTAESIMGCVVKCHCGCVKLMEWEGGGVRVGRKRQKQGEDPGDQESRDDWVNEDNFPLLPPLGLACFVYLVMVEGVERSYLPAIVRQDYLLYINLVHVTTLLARPEKAVTLKGLALLKVLLSLVPTFSLPSYLLDNRRYLQLAELLTSLMTTCAHRSVRQQSVPLLLDLIKCFNDTGRHRIYRSLFRSVGHAGVLGLLTHNIKNEVDQALKVVPADSPFLGPDLAPLLDLTLTISTDTDLLKESDRADSHMGHESVACEIILMLAGRTSVGDQMVMAALNFLRYLLIRDKQEDNQTGVWGMLVKVREQFMTPLRSLLVATRAHCKREVEMRREEAQTGKGTLQEGGPEVTVEVGGMKLPKMSPEEEIQTLHLAQHHLDMMESVMVHTEELMDST